MLISQTNFVFYWIIFSIKIKKSYFSFIGYLIAYNSMFKFDIIN